MEEEPLLRNGAPKDFIVEVPDSPPSARSNSFYGAQNDYVDAWRRPKMHRSVSAPPRMHRHYYNTSHHEGGLRRKESWLDTASYVARREIAWVAVYIAAVIGLFIWKREEFKDANRTHPAIDAVYFCVVTLCTIGYGDIVPDTTATKLMVCALAVAGFGFVLILMSQLVTQALERQEETMSMLLMYEYTHGPTAAAMIVDADKGRMRVRLKVALSVCVVSVCVGIGTVSTRHLLDISWVDSFYLTVMSATTVGYGDYSFTNAKGRVFASAWLLLSSLAMARVCLYFAERRVYRRKRKVAQLVLTRDMTLSDLLAADLDRDGSVSKSEFMVYKLKQMGKVGAKDIDEISKQFDRLDTQNAGKITLSLLSKAGH